MNFGGQLWIVIYSSMFQVGRRHLAVYYTSPQSFMKTFTYSLAQQLWEFFLNLNWFIKLSVQTFQQIIEIYRRGYFVYHQCGCTYSTPSYVPLSYLFRYLPMSTQALKIHNLICPSIYQFICFANNG